MGRKLFLDPATGSARLDRRVERINDTRMDRVFEAHRHIAGAVRHTTDSDDDIVARAKEILRG